MRGLGFLIVGAVAIASSACSEECVREGCEAFEQPQPKGELTQGITGVVAYSTDVCNNGCCECTFGATELKIFGVDDGVRDANDAQARFTDQMPFITLNADMRYSQVLEPGRYAVCDSSLRTCANLEIGRDTVLTLNVRTLHGPTQMRLFDASGTALQDQIVGDGAPF